MSVVACASLLLGLGRARRFLCLPAEVGLEFRREFALFAGVPPSSHGVEGVLGPA